MSVFLLALLFFPAKAMQNNFREFKELVFFDLWILDSGFGFPDSGFLFSVSGFRFPVSGFRFPVPVSVSGLPPILQIFLLGEIRRQLI